MELLKKLTDDELVELYLGGNNGAFETLLLRHKNKVYAHIFNMVRDHDVSDDIFQETFIKVITSIRKQNYTATGKFGSWAMRIAHNLSIDFLRCKQTNTIVSADNPDYNILNSSTLSDTNVEDSMIEEQTSNEILSLINMLPDNQKEIVRMRFYDDLSFKDISEKTGVSINTSLGRMRYAILNMRKLAEEKHIVFSL
ncbi:MAG: sigma-70 family RNA polymerase sigma factor [Paludibacteraceae bacterium]|nr:sigma-70 family RNA polymerase sigma factor [Paludibacteraceae bacterium]MBP6283918.1 sigma-70 family RNA polymerase sigma factor [Paludibacteraceae bacterium]